MASAGAVFKAVSQQLPEIDEMDIPDKEWSIFDEDFLSTSEAIDILWESGVPSMISLGDWLSDVVLRESGVEDADES